MVSRPTFLFRGAAAELIVTNEPRVMIEGPRGTGKSIAVGLKSHLKCTTTPGYRVLWARKTRTSLTDSMMNTYEREILPTYADARFVLGNQGRGNRDRYVYRNGSEIVLGGFDQYGKFRSAEFHLMCFLQAEEMMQGPVEEVLGSNRDLSGRITDLQAIFDVNPGPPHHFLNQWGINGNVLRLKSRHKDNPGLWDADNNRWHPWGEKYLDNIRRQTGANYWRLFEGIWYADEGAIFSYQADQHLIAGSLRKTGEMWQLVTPGREIVLEWFAVGVDWGDASPGAMVVVGFDRDRAGYVVEQHYRRNVTTETWAEVAADIDRRFKPIVFVCDHDKDRIGRFNTRLGSSYGRRVGSVAIRATKSVLAGISEMEEFIRGGQFYILANSLAHAPDTSIADGQPHCLQEELPQYIWYKDRVSGMVTDKPDPGRADHAIDATRYVLMWVRERQYRINTQSPVEAFQAAVAKFEAA